MRIISTIKDLTKELLDSNKILVTVEEVKKKLPFSDAEKTALDLLYLKHYKISEFEEITERLSKKKLIKYVKNYPNKSLKKVKL